MKSKILVFLQFFIIFLMLLKISSETHYLWSGLFISLVGVIIGIVAINGHKKDNFNIRPDIKESCELVTDGIYGYIRHPMYLSVLVMMFGVMLIYLSYYELILYLILIMILLIKLFYEETLWQCHSDAYMIYKKHTKRLFPFIF
jgi:protein-S-isoprenylcysteine O-methyltransferase Ste14